MGFCGWKKRSVVTKCRSHSLFPVTVESPSFFKLRLAPVRRLRTKVVFVKNESAAKHCPSLRAALYFAGMDVVFLFPDFTHPPHSFYFYWRTCLLILAWMGSDRSRAERARQPDVLQSDGESMTERGKMHDPKPQHTEW